MPETPSGKARIVVAMELGLTGPTWQWLDTLGFEIIGFAIIIIFLASWLISVVIWKSKRVDEIKTQMGCGSQ